MTTRTKARPKAGDIAILPVAATLGWPMLRIDDVEFDADGEVVAYLLSQLEYSGPEPGTRIEARRVVAVIPNILTPQEHESDGSR